MSTKAEKILAALGGADNIVEIEPCITRLRTEVKDAALIDEPGLKAAGAHGRHQGRDGRPGRRRPGGGQHRRGHRGPDVSDVVAPVAGLVRPLADVPDPVFAAEMVGAGVAIEPSGGMAEAVSPVAGTLIKLHPHAYVVVTPEGTGVLVHLGIDTVKPRRRRLRAARRGEVDRRGRPAGHPVGPDRRAGPRAEPDGHALRARHEAGSGRQRAHRRHRRGRRLALRVADLGVRPPRVSALLLDLDGTLVDSEPLHRAGFEAWFAPRGWPYDDDVAGLFTGRRADDVFRTVDGPWRDGDPQAMLEEIVAARAARLAGRAAARRRRDHRERPRAPASRWPS